MKESEDVLKQIQNLQQEDTNVFKAVAEKLPEGILIVTEQERHIYANKRATEITGYSVSELLRMTIGDLICFRDIDIIKEKYKYVPVREGALNWHEAVVARKDGTRVPAEITITRTMWHREPATAFIIRAIIERELEVTMRNMEEVIMITSQVGPVPIIVSRLYDGLIGYVNKRFGRLLGLPLDTLVGGFAQNYLYDAADCQRFFAALREQGRLHHFETRFKKADGTIVWTMFSGHSVVLQDDEEWFIGVQEVAEHECGTIDNITSGSGKPVYKRVFQTEDIAIDLIRRAATVGDHEINLTDTERRLLMCLAHNADSVVTYDRLLQAVWGSRYPGDEQLLHTNVCRIRRKMRDIAEKPLSIVTKHGTGYMLTEHAC